MDNQSRQPQMQPCGGGMRVNPLWLPTLEGHRYAEPSAREKVLLDKLEDVTARFEKATEALELIKDELAKYLPSRDKTHSSADEDAMEITDAEVLSTTSSTPTMDEIQIDTPPSPRSKASSPTIRDTESEDSWVPISSPAETPRAATPTSLANCGLGRPKMTQEEFRRLYGMDDEFGELIHNVLMKRMLGSLKKRAEHRR